MSRTLTIVVEADQPEADWIWNTHRDSKKQHGVVVNKIASGDQLAELESEIERLSIVIDMLQRR